MLSVRSWPEADPGRKKTVISSYTFSYRPIEDIYIFSLARDIYKIMNPTSARNSIRELAITDWKNAAKVAEEIQDPWFRCQALAIASLFAPDRKHQLALTEKAFKAGTECAEANRVGTVSSWPVKALYELGFRDEGDKAASRILEIILSVPSPVRRADALNYLLGAVIKSPKSIFWMVYDALFTACTTPLKSGKKNSKGQSLLPAWAGLIMRLDTRRGEALLVSLEGPTHLKKARRNIEIADGQQTNKLISWPNL